MVTGMGKSRLLLFEPPAWKLQRKAALILSRVITHSFWDRHLATVVFGIVLMMGQVGAFAVLQSRVASLESRQQDSTSKSQHDDLVRRVQGLETELVPRSEHLLRDEQLNARLKNIEESVHSIDDRLNQIQREGAKR